MYAVTHSGLLLAKAAILRLLHQALPRLLSFYSLWFLFPKNVYFLSTVYVTVISRRLHSQLVMRNEGILKNGTEFLMKTGGKKDFS